VDLDLVAVGSCVVLVERQHIQRAAVRLQVTPSVLTKSVQLLER
jgi:DNA-binding transcriptional LysR family regulator